MSAAFYLFRIPKQWSRMMVFNVRFLGQQLGLQDNVWYRPGCAVIPMGCASAVSIMQEIAERLTFIGRLPAANQVRRLAPLPTWLTAVLEEARGAGKPWFHVYLDNFCAMEKGAAEALPGAGATMHQALEQAWASSGVLSFCQEESCWSKFRCTSLEPLSKEFRAPWGLAVRGC